MKRLLIVTTLDYGYYSNNRVHHLVDQFKQRFEDVTVMYTKVYIAKTHTLYQQLKGLLTLSLRTQNKGNVRFIEVDRFLNHIGGLGLNILGLDTPYLVPHSLIKRVLRRIFSTMGFISDLAILPSFFIAYLLKDRSKKDVFIGQGPWEVAFGYLLRQLGLVKTLIYDDFDYSPGYQYISKFRRFYTSMLEIFCLKRADLIISVGSLLARLREDQTGRKVHIIPNGVDYRHFQKAQIKKPHPRTLIYMGYIYDWAGLDLIVEALAKIKQDISDIRFLILGHTSPDYIKKILNMAKDLGVDRHVQYLGNKRYRELIDYLAEADVGMAVFRPVELRRYAFSLKVIEYMSSGLPVITTKDTQSGSLVEDYQCGEAVEYNTDDIVRAIHNLLLDKDRYKRYSENAKRFSREYDWEELLGKRYYELIKEYYQQDLVTNR
ncbi:MAG: glycosyltransferase family 4 protein [Nitrospinae bacterium]|nr:glycosyltransferase family 4 protein [Nitrospinota bacterium]